MKISLTKDRFKIKDAATKWSLNHSCSFNVLFVYLTIRQITQVFYERIANEAQPSWLSLREKEGEFSSKLETILVETSKVFYFKAKKTKFISKKYARAIVFYRRMENSEITNQIYGFLIEYGWISNNTYLVFFSFSYLKCPSIWKYHFNTKKINTCSSWHKPFL